jgi:single-strand DNA-binding protein
MSITKGINSVVLIGRVVSGPEHHVLTSGCGVCRMRLAVDGVRRDPVTGDTDENPSLFAVSVFGAEADRAAALLRDGGWAAVQGRLQWQAWETDDGEFEESVTVVAESVQFLGASGDDEMMGEVVEIRLRHTQEQAPLDMAEYA